MYALVNNAGQRGAWVQDTISNEDLQHYIVYKCPNKTIAERIVQASQRLNTTYSQEQYIIEVRVLRLAYKFLIKE